MVHRNRFVQRYGHAGLTGIALCLWASPVFGLVNLELRPVNPTVAVGAQVDLGLYAVSDDLTTQRVNGMNVVIAWDPAKLQLLGFDQTGAAFGVFFPQFPPGGLNEAIPPADGEGYWVTFTFPYVDATPAGALMTTFQFTALAPSAGTPVQIPAEASEGSDTIVYVGPVPNVPGTGTLNGSTVVINGPGGPLPVPTVSQWGLIILTLLLLTAGTVLFGRGSTSATVTRS